MLKAFFPDTRTTPERPSPAPFGRDPLAAPKAPPDPRLRSRRPEFPDRAESANTRHRIGYLEPARPNSPRPDRATLPVRLRIEPSESLWPRTGTSVPLSSLIDQF